MNTNSLSADSSSQLLQLACISNLYASLTVELLDLVETYHTHMMVDDGVVIVTVMVMVLMAIMLVTLMVMFMTFHDLHYIQLREISHTVQPLYTKH